MQKSVSELVGEIQGEKRMRKPPSRDEFYKNIDGLIDVIRSHKQRLEALEGQKDTKPRYRVPAKTRSI